MEPFTETETLARLISEKGEILEQIRDLSRRQRDMVGSGDLSQLMRLLTAKEKLLQQLQRVERDLQPFRNQDPDSRRWRTTDDRQRCRQEAERCGTLLGEILLLEKQSEGDMVRRRDQTAERLQGAHTAQRARQAYTQMKQPSPPAAFHSDA